MRISLFLVLACVPACAPRPVPPPEPAGGRPATGPFTYHLHQIFVPAVINGVPVGEALIDTGASACAIDSSVADRIDLGPRQRSTVHGTAGAVQAESVQVASLSVFGAEASGVAATVYDLGHGATPSGEPLAMIIGYPYLRHFAVDVDFGVRRLAFRRVPSSGRNSIPMRLDNGIPVVELSLNGGPPTPFRIDTGPASSTLMTTI